MKNPWTNLMTGVVKVKANGKGTERLLNKLMKANVHIWDVKRKDAESIIFTIDYSEVFKLRQAVRKSECKVSFISGNGGPFFLKRLKKNSGFIVGLLAFLLCIFILSNMVWGIKIYEADPATEHEIRKELDSIGVKVGKIQFFLDSPETIQRKLTESIGRLTYVGVDLKGTIYHLKVVEKKQPEEVIRTGPQHLVAKKKAIITDMLVEKGQAKVNVHDYVTKGQLLVSGIIGREEKPEVVSATGKIMGETWYKATVKMPLKTRFSVYNGDEYSNYYLTGRGFSLPVWGFSHPTYKQFEEETVSRPFHFLQWELPIGFKTKTQRSKEIIVREYTKEQAVVQAKMMAKSDLEKILDEDASIVGEKILHERIENGKIILSIHFQVIENIATGLPIIQGD